MGTRYVAVQLTDTEADILDWVRGVNEWAGRSETLRNALLQLAHQLGIAGQVLSDAYEERASHPARYRRPRPPREPRPKKKRRA